MGPNTAVVRYTPQGARAQIEIDGQNISNIVQRFTIDHRGGQVPEVFLELRPDASDVIECEAVVHVVRTEPADELAAVADWLEPLDAEQFEIAVLAAMELGGPQTFGAAALEVLKGWVRRGE